MSAIANKRHLAGVLAAVDDGYLIGALGQAVMRIFSAITYPQAVYQNLTVNGLRSVPDSA